uniref:Uncharacterized protein n=1 Tax=mine drainage metagenome TaxID=410659 RepID=E6PXM9_9ZZZZ
MGLISPANGMVFQFREERLGGIDFIVLLSMRSCSDPTTPPVSTAAT